MAEVEARTVLWHLAFMGFIVNYMIRINVNITIVDMIVGKGNAPSPVVATNPPHIVSGNTTERLLVVPLEAAAEYQNITGNASSHTEKYSLEKHFLNWANIEYEKDGFHWNEYQQGLLLGSFFWAHWILQIPGGILARKYGTKLVFGLANATGVFCCFLIPIVSYWSFAALIWLRVFQGFITGLAWPAMHVLTGKWIPPNERSKFVTAYLGSSVGVALFYPIFGYIIHWTSWEWVYHICGFLGTAWFIAWQYFVFDSPAEHPRIAPSELRYIEKSLGASVQTNSNLGPTPWRAILTSRPVWMNVIAQWGGIWGLFTLMTQAPTYFRVIHHWNIRATGFLSGLPHLMRMLFAYVFSIFADYLLRTDRMSRTNVRKLATAVCCLVKGLVVLALAYFGYNATAAIVLVTMATMFHGAVSSGPLASVVDLSPNYAGISLGQTLEAWKNVFLIAAGMLITSGVLYVLFGESTLQPWNSSSFGKDGGLKELQIYEEKQPLQVEKQVEKREAKDE
ncbi:sialin isoform X2 [Scaptodrosophila lebanonensis]|uniref:Sialin isoform X2 n=1 Tax=Drosophila lebanonensis TaxID=7225 RepID=A0A6J2UJG9_DROLE|nr:sialin isoform X2 [Scaptodrosophila lebanonensis]